MSFRCAGASVIGQGHARRSAPCQDACGWAVIGERMVIAVADGAGSAPCAEQGSRLAVGAALDVLIEEQLLGRRPPAAQLERAFRLARAALLEEAGRLGKAPWELSTTLLACIATPQWTAAAQVGDGAVVIVGEQGIEALTRPVHGEYCNTTIFLTAEDALQRMQCRLVGPAHHVAVFTDGIETVAVHHATGEPHAPFFTGLFAFMDAPMAENERARAIEAFLGGERLAQRCDDDKTLVVGASP